MRFPKLTAAVLALAAATPALAQDEESSAFTVTGSVGLVSDYRFRGVSQSDKEMAIQGGITINHESGFYAGFWGSNIDFNDGFFSGKEAAELELDLFVGYGFELDENTKLDLNFTYYAYPGSYDAYDYDFWEIIVGLSHDFGVASVGIKGAYTPDTFGADEEAFWLGGNLTVPVTDWLSISGNVGEQWFEFGDDYTHYDIGLTATYEGVTFDARYVATDLDYIDEEFVFSVGFGF